MRNVLIVSTVDDAEAVLRDQVGDADMIKVVVPVVRQGLLDRLANDERAFAHAERVAERTAERVAERTAERLPGETAETRAISAGTNPRKT